MRIIDYRAVSFDTVDPSLKPMSQREISFGVEKKLMENLSATARLVQKHLRYAVEDVGVVDRGGHHLLHLEPRLRIFAVDRRTAASSTPSTPPAPRPSASTGASISAWTRRFSNGWLGGLSYTWSRLTGNYSGLASSDEIYTTGDYAGQGRNSPNVERAFDIWYLAYDKSLSPIDGPLATDRPHVFKFYGAYTFPFRLTVGAVIAASSGMPFTEYWNIEGDYKPYNRGNLGRSPFLWFTNLYAEYSLRLGKTSLNFNVNVDNVFNIATTTMYWPYRTLYNLDVTEDEILSGDWELETSGYEPDNRFKQDVPVLPADLGPARRPLQLLRIGTGPGLLPDIIIEVDSPCIERRRYGGSFCLQLTCPPHLDNLWRQLKPGVSIGQKVPEVPGRES